MKFEAEIRELGWNLIAFSRISGGISPQTVKRIDRGKTTPRPETVERIRAGIRKIRARVASAKAS